MTLTREERESLKLIIGRAKARYKCEYVWNLMAKFAPGEPLPDDLDQLDNDPAVRALIMAIHDGGGKALKS